MNNTEYGSTPFEQHEGDKGMTIRRCQYKSVVGEPTLQLQSLHGKRYQLHSLTMQGHTYVVFIALRFLVTGSRDEHSFPKRAHLSVISILHVVVVRQSINLPFTALLPWSTNAFRFRFRAGGARPHG